MLYIKPYTSADNLPEFDAAFRQGRLAYTAFSGRELLGWVFYRKEGDRLFIEEVEAKGDQSLFDGLIRTVCDAAVNSRLPAVCFGPKVDRSVLQALSVPVDREGRLDNLPEFLHNCARCGH